MVNKMLKKLSKRSKQYNADPLRDVEVSLEEAEAIIASIREKFEVQDLLDKIHEKMQHLEDDYGYQFSYSAG